MVMEVFSKKLKKLFKKKRRRDDRGTGIVTKTLPVINLRTTPEPGASINERDLISFCPESECRRHASITGSDNERVHWRMIISESL
jgi:hypothetical protein